MVPEPTKQVAHLVSISLAASPSASRAATSSLMWLTMVGSRTMARPAPRVDTAGPAPVTVRERRPGCRRNRAGRRRPQRAGTVMCTDSRTHRCRREPLRFATGSRTATAAHHSILNELGGQLLGDDNSLPVIAIPGERVGECHGGFLLRLSVLSRFATLRSGQQPVC
jgi:hypothetical protein